jgi:CRP-like cAMP-binding protein
MDQVINILSKIPEIRTNAEVEELLNYFSKHTFFQELVSQDESGYLYKECLKIMKLECFMGEVCIEAGIYEILQGSLVIINPELDSLPKNYRRNLSLNFKGSKIPDEITIEAGMMFGDIDKDKKYVINCNERCYVAILLKADYNSVLQKSEELLTEKIDFLKGLEIFKHWSRLAVKNASYAFDKRKYRKGNYVYKEKEFPAEVYIVADGEFKFTQKFNLDHDKINEDNHVFGENTELKQNQIRKPGKPKDLQILIKQKGDIFGYNEIYQKKDAREFTCTCISTTGELFVINEKEFTKRLSHPETLKLLEEYNQVFIKWTGSRVKALKQLEEYKYKLSFTPKSLIKIQPRKSELATKKALNLQSTSPPPKLPHILNKMIEKNKKIHVSIRTKETSFSIFPTEISLGKISARTKSSRLYNKIS